MRFKRSVLALLFAGLFLLSLAGPAFADTFEIGHVFAGVNDGLVYHYDGAGNHLDTLDCGYGGFTTGMAFDADGNLYVTEFSNAYITVFSGPDDPHTILQRIYTGDLGDRLPESIVFDADGNFYVGHAGGNADIHKYGAAGNRLDTYDVDTEIIGSDWIELAADQHTIFYTSEGTTIFRYDVDTKTQLTPFATGLPGSNAFALRILPDGGVLVADRNFVLRLDSAGNVIQTYDVDGEDTWFSLNLDPDGTSFWSGNFGTDRFYKFDIESGSVLQMVDTGLGGYNLYGLVVYGEITAARKKLIAKGWGKMWAECRFVRGPAELYMIGEEAFELVVTYKGEDYSRTWQIERHYFCSVFEVFDCYDDSGAFLKVTINHQLGYVQTYVSARFNGRLYYLTHDLTIGVVGSGATDPAPGVHTYDEGMLVSVDALPAAGWMLDHWELDGVDVGSADPYDVTMDADHTLTAVFVTGRPLLYVYPPEISANVGQSFTVDIAIQEVTDLFSYEFRLGFDPDVLSVASVDEGAFLWGPLGTLFYPLVEADYVYVAHLILGGYPGISGSGVLCSITFNVIDAGECDLDLYGTTMLDSNGVLIAHSLADGHFS